MPKRRLSIVLFLALVTPAQASPWHAVDMGSLHKPAHCLNAAGQTFEAMLGEVRIGRLYTTEWIAYADQINGKYDAMITCTNSGGTWSRATLVIHSNTRRIDAHMLIRRLVQIFDAKAQEITRAWKDSYQ